MDDETVQLKRVGDEWAEIGNPQPGQGVAVPRVLWRKVCDAWRAVEDAERDLDAYIERPPTHRCRGCRAPRHVDLHEVTGRADIVRGVRTFLWGRWQVCGHCGDAGEPEPVVDEADVLTRPL